MLKYKFRNVNQDSYRSYMVPLLGLEAKEMEDESIIKNPEEFKSIIDAYHAVEENFTWDITLNGSIISVSLNNTNVEGTGYSYSFDYNDLKEISTTNTLWCISKEFFSKQDSDKGLVQQSDFINMFLHSIESKNVSSPWKEITDTADLKFYIPKNNCSIEDMRIVIPKPLSWSDPIHPYLINSITDSINPVDPTKMGDTILTVTGDAVNDGSFDNYTELFPTITTTSTTSDGFITVTVNTDFDTLFLEPEVGFLTKTKLDIVNGTGKFTVITNGLDVGETVSVKFNTKYWSDVYRFTKTI